ncbi:hypothetical protein ACIA58_22945 [Kribbella sp. NPDC051586]|uniref:hypothetical protein n=1 Tax=Kribbella sp. NPDC051586 TaxID=3364118 RepID=UPI0037A9744A
MIPFRHQNASSTRGSEGLEIMGSEPGDEVDPSLIDSLKTAALRERAAGVLAEYHQIELTEARMLLVVLAEYLGLSADAVAAEVLDSAAARRAEIEDPPQSQDIAPE